MPLKREYLQAYSNEIWHCNGCDADFHPQIKTQSIWMRLGLIALVLATFAFFVYGPNEKPWIWLKLPWLAALVALPVISLFLRRSITRRRKVADPARNVRYGDIIPVCLHCGSPLVYLLMEGEGGRNYRLRP